MQSLGYLPESGAVRRIRVVPRFRRRGLTPILTPISSPRPSASTHKRAAQRVAFRIPPVSDPERKSHGINQKPRRCFPGRRFSSCRAGRADETSASAHLTPDDDRPFAVAPFVASRRERCRPGATPGAGTRQQRVSWGQISCRSWGHNPTFEACAASSDSASSSQAGVAER